MYSHINVISDEIVHPQNSVLKSLLLNEGQYPEDNTRVGGGADNMETSAPVRKVDLLEGLGQNFLDEELAESTVLDNYNEDPNNYFAWEIAPDLKFESPEFNKIINDTLESHHATTNVAPMVIANTDIAPTVIPNMDYATTDIVPTVIANKDYTTTGSITAATPPSCPPTPRSHFSQASSALPSPGSFYDDVFNAEEDRPLSPIISGKRKRLQRGGKGRKMTWGRSPTNAALSSSSSTLTPHDVFSQPEDKAVVRRFKALGNKVRGQRKVIEDKERTSGKRKILVIQQHQEAVTKRTNDKTRLDELSEAIKDLKKEFVRQKDKFNESDEVVNRLEREVRDVSAQHDDDVRQLERIIEKVAQLDNII